jgi:hypothetical protein
MAGIDEHSGSHSTQNTLYGVAAVMGVASLGGWIWFFNSDSEVEVPNSIQPTGVARHKPRLTLGVAPSPQGTGLSLGAAF